MRNLDSTYKLFILLHVLVHLSTNAVAQLPGSYSYQYYNTSNGLSSPEILCLARDERGFLWMGTSSGLSMYDGYNFKNYSYSRENALLGSVNVIRTDSSGRLWIGAGAGLFCFQKNELLKISAATSLPQGVNDILLDGDSILWLATENGPAKLNIHDIDLTGRKKVVMIRHLLEQWYLKNEIIANRRTILINKAPDGTVYMAQGKNLFRFIDNKLDLVYTTGDDRDKILSLFPVSRSTIYFDASATEINKIEDGIASTIPFRDLYQEDPGSLLPGKWYVGTRGAFYFHPQKGTASRFIAFSDKYVVWATAVMEDNDFLWVASHDGLVKLKPSFFTHYTVDRASSYNDYYSITELRNGKLLFGANVGNVFEKRAHSFSIFRKMIVPSAEIKGLYEDERGWLWVASGYQGLALVRNGRVERFFIEDGLQDNSLAQVMRTENGGLYAVGEQGISEIIIGKDQKITFHKHYYQPNTSQYARFFSAVEAPDGSIWMGGEEGIVYLRDDSLHKFSFSGRQYSINSIIKDRENKIWIATSDAGILQCVFNQANHLEIVRQYTENDGLNTLRYLTLLADKENNIWAGSSRGISVIGRAGKFRQRTLNFDESDGFIKSGYSYIRLYQATDSIIWVATTFGIASFNPARISLTDNPPAVYITEIRQIERNQFISDNAIRHYPDNNKFNHSSNSFTFKFTALDYVNQEHIRYYYKLEGLDTGWVNYGDLRSISFENLAPGHYIFRVKALNSKSIWSKSDAVYSFTITPPFWKKWWFLSLLAITMAMIAFWGTRSRIQFVKRREAEKTALQQLRAANYREQLEIEQIINHFATSMNSVNSVDDILWDIVRNCISKLNFEDCVIYLKDADLNVFVQKAAWGPKMTAENEIIRPIALAPGAGIVGSVALNGIAEIVNDTSLDERYIVDDAKRMSEITVPILHGGEVIGIIDSEHSQKYFYTQRHLQILTTISSLCAGKIDTIKAEMQIRTKEMEVLRLNKDFATSQLTALRMQMNPHFIFNALNSVQHYILQGNVVEANKYLSKFSKLQREILHCSNEQFITLEKEIEILGRYLELEQYRFGESFTYHINMTDEIEPVEIKIPPMVLQPFVENAIWHGLMPRQKERTLSIYFELHSDDILLATLRDNGIGREASAALKRTNGGDKTGHESKGMSMVQQRLQLLQQLYDEPFEVAISDITDINGIVQGTQVTLKIFIGNKKL